MGPLVRRWVSGLASATLAATSLGTVARARAGEEQDKVIATDLFDKGIKKMEEGKCDQPTITDPAACQEAREHFRKAYQVYPAGLGALRNLAYVERGLHLYASSARRFRELERKAPDDPNPKRHVWAEYARKELETIEPLVPHLTVKPPATRPAAMKIVLDDAPLPEAVWATSLDVDPGSHVLHAEGEGVAPFDSKFEMAEKESKTVEVVFPAESKPEKSDKPKETKPPSRVPPLVIMIGGGVFVVAGLAFGTSAILKRRHACGSSNFCEPRELDEAKSAASTANVLTAVGLVAGAAGALWYFLASPKQPQKGMTLVPYASLDGAGASAVVRF